MSNASRFATLLVSLTLAATAHAQDAAADSAAYQLGRLAGIALVVYVIWRIFRKRKS